MKRSFSLLCTIALFPCQLAFSNSTGTAVSSQLLPQKNETLMASDLSAKQLKNLHLSSNLFYAKNHEFYDTPVKLKDNKGHVISHKNQLNMQHHYELVSIGDTLTTSKNVWFFKMDGVIPDEDSSLPCTAEKPCSISQKLVDKIHALKQDAKLWLASGTYDLPEVNQDTLHPKLLELHVGQTVDGRTADYRHNANKTERPVILGTLSFNDFYGHEGIWGFLNNLIIRTSDNPAQVDDKIVNTNAHSTGDLWITNCELENFSTQYFTNIDAVRVGIESSSLNGKNWAATYNGGENIHSYDFLGILNSNLKVAGKDVRNIRFIGGEPDGMSGFSIGTSNIESIGCSITSIYMQDAKDVYIFSSQLKLQQHESGCAHYFYNGGAVIWANDYETSQSFVIEKSSISIFTKDNRAAGIYSNSKFLKLDGSKITAHSEENDAEGIINDAGGVSNVPSFEFIGEASLISVSSPTNALITNFALMLNNSSPPSQCSINNGTASNCGEPDLTKH